MQRKHICLQLSLLLHGTSDSDMKRRIKNILPVLFVLAFILSCTERIELPLDESSVKLVVEGTITTNTSVHTIYLTETTNYYYNQKPPAVTGAEISITDGETITRLSETSPGVYQTSPGFKGVVGMTSHWRIF